MPSTMTFIPNPGLQHEWEHSHEAHDLVQDIGEKVADTARELAPVDTGDLAGSIRVEVGDVDGKPGASIVADVPYAGYVETGTSDTPAQPYLRPALERVKD